MAYADTVKLFKGKGIRGNVKLFELKLPGHIGHGSQQIKFKRNPSNYLGPMDMDDGCRIGGWTADKLRFMSSANTVERGCPEID